MCLHMSMPNIDLEFPRDPPMQTPEKLAGLWPRPNLPGTISLVPNCQGVITNLDGSWENLGDWETAINLRRSCRNLRAIMAPSNSAAYEVAPLGSCQPAVSVPSRLQHDPSKYKRCSWQGCRGPPLMANPIPTVGQPREVDRQVINRQEKMMGVKLIMNPNDFGNLNRRMK